MINKKFPVRHRLITKTNKGTTLDGKPYQRQWKAAIDALGLSLPGTIMFASKVLLVEGDSDPVFVNAILQKLISLGKINADGNSLAVISTGDSKNTDALIRIIERGANGNRALLLYLMATRAAMVENLN
jgi:hypothetical protein